MAAFPINIEDHLFSLKPGSVKPANRQTSSAGYTMSFSRATVKKKVFDFTLFNLNQTDWETLDTFFDTNQGGSFTIDFSCTGDSTTYTVVFDQDELIPEYTRSFPGNYTVPIVVREA